MSYTYNIPNKTSGVQLASIITQKNNRDYKLLSAKDLAWNVTLNDNTVINSTDDLLDYISASHATAVSTAQNSMYKIECSTTACYEGTVFNDNPSIQVYRIKNSQLLLLTYQGVINEGLTIQFSTTSGATNIILYSSDKQCLSGIAHSGTYTMTLKKESTVVATFSILVLKQSVSSVLYTIYRLSDTLLTTPTGGSYDFTTNTFTAPSGWTTDVSSLTGTLPIWWSTGTIFSDGQSNPVWSAPCIYLTDTDFKSTDKYRSDTIAIYLAVKNGSAVPNKPSGGSLVYPNTFTEPDIWCRSLLAAIDSYNNLCSSGDENKHTVYVSYNTYTVKIDKNGAYSDQIQTGWTSPSEYLNIDDILEIARTDALSIASDAVEDALEDIADVSNLASDITTVKLTVNSLYEWTILGQNKGSCSEIIKGDDEYEYFELYENEYEDLVTELSSDDFNKVSSICTQQYLNKCIWFESIIDPVSNDLVLGYVAYIPATKIVKTQLTNYLSTLNTVLTAVNSMTPSYIRLLASKGYLDNVTWTSILKSVYDALNSSNKHTVTTLPETGYVYGDYYKAGTTVYNYYRCDYPISTGFMKVLSDKVSIGVRLTISGNTINAGITCKIDNNTPTIDLTAASVAVTGSLIAKAIEASEANINNTTYLKTNGDVYFAQGTGKKGSLFYADGHGSLAGGGISWNTSGDLTIKGSITADSGYIGGQNGWSIVSTPIPALYAIDSSNNEILISTQYLESKVKNAANPNWQLLRDGTAKFAKGNVVFNNDGTAKIGNDTANISLTSNGTVSLTGINLTLSSTEQTLIINSTKDSITGDETFKGVIVNSVGTNIVGQLDTEDISVGNGACFFKGTDAANSSAGYVAGTKGSGHVANGNIKWDKDGNLNISGVTCYLSAKGTATNNSAYSIHVIDSDGQLDNDPYILPYINVLSGGSCYKLLRDAGSGRLSRKILLFAEEYILPPGEELLEITIWAEPCPDVNTSVNRLAATFSIKGNFQFFGKDADKGIVSELRMRSDGMIKLLFDGVCWRPLVIFGDMEACIGAGSHAGVYYISSNGAKIELPDESSRIDYEINTIEGEGSSLSYTVYSGPKSWVFNYV